jgi:hypothetical protein
MDYTRVMDNDKEDKVKREEEYQNKKVKQILSSSSNFPH